MIFTKKRKYNAKLFGDLSKILNETNLRTISVTRSGSLLVLVSPNKPDLYEGEEGEAQFPKVVPDEKQNYIIYEISTKGIETEVKVNDMGINIHHVQKFSDGSFLVACARSYCEDKDTYDKNGIVISSNGKNIKQFLLGDGINDLQVSADDTIWAGYFDEGVFGNYGWGRGIDPVGMSGLVAWNREGEKIYEYEPANGLDNIIDCYALNVASESDTWIYYYTQFPLVRLRNMKIVNWWKVPVSGSHTFAVHEDMALFAGDYKDREHLFLYKLNENNKMKLTEKIVVVGPSGESINIAHAIARGRRMFFCDDKIIYAIDLMDF